MREADGTLRPDTRTPACPAEGLPRAARRFYESNGRCFALLVDGSVYLRETAGPEWLRLCGPATFGKGETISSILPHGGNSIWIGTRGGKLFLLPLDRLRGED